jgi:hypothetical protein
VTDRTTPVLAIATFALVATAATLILGNALGTHPCGAGWTGYAPIGECVNTFWSPAFFVGPLIGLAAAAGATLLVHAAVRRASTHG